MSTDTGSTDVARPGRRPPAASRPGLIRSIAHRLAGEQLALPVEGHLASFDGATGWLNSEPLTPEGLRGRVVLVDFWTYTCVNWLRTLPYVRAWAAKYADAGLTVIGVHTPEFGFERDVDNVVAQSRAFGVEYPIAIDSDYGVWRAFDNHFWPAVYIADAEGRIRYHHFGEGEYAATEMVDPAAADRRRRGRRRPGPRRRSSPRARGRRRLADAPVARDVRRLRPEHRLRAGGRRARSTSRTPTPRRRGCPSTSGRCRGRGRSRGTRPCSNEPGGRIAFRFHARDVNLVMGPAPRGAADPVPGLPRRPAAGRRARDRRRRRRQRDRWTSSAPTS